MMMSEYEEEVSDSQLWSAYATPPARCENEEEERERRIKNILRVLITPQQLEELNGWPRLGPLVRDYRPDEFQMAENSTLRREIEAELGGEQQANELELHLVSDQDLFFLAPSIIPNPHGRLRLWAPRSQTWLMELEKESWWEEQSSKRALEEEEEEDEEVQVRRERTEKELKRMRVEEEQESSSQQTRRMASLWDSLTSDSPVFVPLSPIPTTPPRSEPVEEEENDGGPGVFTPLFNELLQSQTGGGGGDDQEGEEEDYFDMRTVNERRSKRFNTVQKEYKADVRLRPREDTRAAVESTLNIIVRILQRVRDDTGARDTDMLRLVMEGQGLD